MKSGKLIKKQGNQVVGVTANSLNESGNGLHHRIAIAAYELYEKRGRVDGYDLDDWFKAERLVSNRTE